MSRIPLGPLSGNSLGDYLREQRQSARLSLRQLSELAGISNPYLSQIERGLKRPSAEILQQLAKGLEVSSESLYVRAGILDERHGHDTPALDTRAAIDADPHLTDRQKATLVDIYESFVGSATSKPRRRARTSSTNASSKNASSKSASSTSTSSTSTSSKRTTTAPTQGD